jgi:hypothetical protein
VITKALVAILVVCAFGCGQPTGLKQCLPRQQAWLPSELKWQKPLPDMDLETAEATLLAFHNDGSFVMVRCLLNRTRKGLNISIGDGLSMFEGTWTMQRGSEIEVMYSLAERIPRVVNRPTEKGRASSERAVLSSSGDCDSAQIVLGNQRFSPTRTLDPRDVEQFMRRRQRK